MNYSTKALDCALNYAERGWFVIPLHSVENGQCTCKRQCKSPGKHPIFNNWQAKATTDPAQIKQWWNKYSFANIGIVTGQKSGLVVIDIDPRNGGDASLQDLIDAYADFNAILATYTVMTGGNGSHFYYHYSKAFKSLKNHGLGKGIDIKADGGYILAPPSNHVSGGVYSVLHDFEPLPLPPMLIDLITAGQSESTSNKPEIVEGGRNDTLMALAAEQFRQGKTLERVQVFLLEENTLRCKPPLENKEVIGMAKSLASSFKPEAAQASFKTQWQQAILESGLGSGFAHVLMALSLYMDVEGRNCYPTEETIAERIRITRKSVSGHLKRAVDVGFLSRYLRGVEGKRGFSYGYIAQIPANQDR
ncbi:hypothetical protein METHB2_240003 [Candidatus Methylobacter favarea]|uniref:DNA primase/polymerase bifunctional N-terminal domain-containing protein n=1 Tax=Candidatus Methylobacter favarea TaxID=2707345 RepID=A0A8S0X7Z5_9GAMM|nr:bifunctional DNA primase/polymerase [Candidatus Methylobacter favarea]CAA9890530.1 hypothetical protein METHB2_240003 [Candidatus Methylobacter favarea]